MEAGTAIGSVRTAARDGDAAAVLSALIKFAVWPTTTAIR